MEQIMNILLIGGSGHIGSLVVRELVERRSTPRVLTRDPSKLKLPAGATAVKGDFNEPDSLRAALAGTDAAFVLMPVVVDELTQALVTLSLAAEAKVKRVVYFSMLNADTFSDCPHAAAKYAAERAIKRLGLAATILRPNYFMQNDVEAKDAITGKGIYPMPIANVGVSMIDARDIAEAAALALLQQNGFSNLPAGEVIELSGPDALTGDSAASIWTEVLGRKVTYGGHDLRAVEKQFRAKTPPQMAYDVALMFRGFVRDGMLASAGAVERLVQLLGRPLRTYRAFAEETGNVKGARVDREFAHAGR